MMLDWSLLVSNKVNVLLGSTASTVLMCERMGVMPDPAANAT